MKVSREEETFKPVTITLESYEEAKIVKELLGMMCGSYTEKILGKQYNVQHMYDAIEDKTKDVKISGKLWMEIKVTDKYGNYL